MFRRVWLLVAIATTVVLGPKLFPGERASTPPLEVTLAVGHPDLALVPEPELSSSASPGVTVVLSPPEVTTTTGVVDQAAITTTTEAPASSATEATDTSTTSTTAAPQATTTTSAPPPEKASETSTAPTTTTTTTAAPAAAASPAPPVAQADGTQFGDVSWYDLEGARSGICAHRYLDKGTVVTVTNLGTGRSITCTVDDRGPYSGDGKVLDLFRDDFARLAPLEEGVVAARLDW